MFDGLGQTWSLILSVAPLVVAMMVAITRVMDYRHHWQDVTVGALLGLLIAYISYRLYFPPITDERCYEPLEARFKAFEQAEDDPSAEEQV